MFKDQSPIFTATDLTDWACLGLVHQFFRFVPNLLYQVFDWGCQIRSCTTYSYQEKAIFGSYIGRLRWSYCIRSLIGSQIGFIRSLSNVLLSRRGCVWFRHSWQIVFWWHTLASSVGSAWCYYFLVFLCGATDWFYCLVLLFGATVWRWWQIVFWWRTLVPAPFGAWSGLVASKFAGGGAVRRRPPSPFNRGGSHFYPEIGPTTPQSAPIWQNGLLCSGFFCKSCEWHKITKSPFNRGGSHNCSITVLLSGKEGF